MQRVERKVIIVRLVRGGADDHSRTRENIRYLARGMMRTTKTKWEIEEERKSFPNKTP